MSLRLSASCQALSRGAAASLARRTTVARMLLRTGSFKRSSLNQTLSIWDAYATIHLLMPAGSMKLGGEAVAEVLRRLPRTRWFTWIFRVRVLRIRPFQAILNLAYAILADVRPIFGCESCGEPSPWMRTIMWIVRWIASRTGESRHVGSGPHFTPLTARKRPTQVNQI